GSGRTLRAAGSGPVAADGRGPSMMAVDLSRQGTTASVPRKDKQAAPGDGGFGAQMQKALAAGPLERRGGGDRPPVSASSASSAPDRSGSGAEPEAGVSAPSDTSAPGAGPEAGVSGPDTQEPAAVYPGLADPAPLGKSGAAPVTGLEGQLSTAPLAGATSPGLQLTESATTESTSDAAGAVPGSAFVRAKGFLADGTLPDGTGPAAAIPGATGSAAPSGGSGVPAPSPAPSVPGAAAARPGTAGPAPASLQAPVTAVGSAGTAEAPTFGAAASSATAASPGTPAAAPAGADAPPVQAAGAVPPTGGTVTATQPATQPAALAQPADLHQRAVSVPGHPPLAGQLAGPLFSLATAKPGEHTMTLRVTPENLGPVTVRAHIGAEGVRVELFAPNDAGRDALRSVLQDLKRDLASAGLGTNLDLSARSGPDDRPQGGAGEPSGNGPRQFQGVPSPALPGHDTHPHLRHAGTTGLDVLA
ncbi:MAG: flagellar hook-length control protein FliK, partial [Arthrobacter sp.]